MPGADGPRAGDHGEEEAMGKTRAPQPRRTRPAAQWTDRYRTIAVALELLLEGSRILKDLLGGWPW
jgi:hypothetical protein